MKRTIILICIVFLMMPALVSAESYIDYLEGYLEVLSSGSWEEVGIGDVIPDNAKIRLSDDGYAELLVGDAVVSLTRDGTYEVSELMKGSSNVSSSGLDLKKKLTLNTSNEKWQHEATMGVRGAEASVSDSTGMEDAYTYLEAGIESLVDGDYDDALINFEEGWDFFEDQNCLFFMAVSYEALGEKRSYVRSLQDIELDYLEPEYQSDYVIRMSDLLIRSLAYGDAVDLIDEFEGYGNSLSGDDEQQIQYLKGMAFLGAGNRQKARSALQKAEKLAPSSPIGQQAAQALSSL